jgi:DNA polymerase V
VTAARVIPASEAAADGGAYEQMDLFTDYEALEKERAAAQKAQEREKKMQKAVLEIRKRFGSNSIVRGMNLQEGATAMERNSQIGGHKA